MFTTVSESTLQESAGQQTDSTPLTPAGSRLVLGNRQIAATLFVVLALITAIAALSYLAGRATTGVAAPTVSASIRQAPQPAPEQVIVVDPKPSAAAPMQPAAPAAVPPSVTPAGPIVPTAPIVLPSGPDAPPAPGTVFFQVASVDKGMAEVSVQYLLEKGFQARLVPGISPKLYRVLVGPLGGASAQPDQTEAKLKELGFTPFPKKY